MGYSPQQRLAARAIASLLAPDWPGGPDLDPPAFNGIWGDAVDLIVDPYTSKNQNMIECTAVLMCDVAVRHPEAFSKSDAVLTT